MNTNSPDQPALVFPLITTLAFHLQNYNRALDKRVSDKYFSYFSTKNMLWVLIRSASTCFHVTFLIITYRFSQEIRKISILSWDLHQALFKWRPQLQCIALRGAFQYILYFFMEKHVMGTQQKCHKVGLRVTLMSIHSIFFAKKRKRATLFGKQKKRHKENCYTC